MIISRTPYRISFFGGGTDYPAWFEGHGGAVLSTAINKYCYLTVRHLPPFFAHRSRIVWSEIELVKDIPEIHHPLVRECLRYVGIHEGVEIHHDGDLPARSGIGSSSSFAVGLLNALYALKGRMASAEQLASNAIYVEQDMVGDCVGCQDQVAAAFGGFNRIDFMPGGSFRVMPIVANGRVKLLEKHLMLVFTGLSRLASEIAKEQVKLTPQRETELSIMQDMVNLAMEQLVGDGDILEFGRLLNEAWKLKKSLSPHISTPGIDQIYDAALGAGALGGKLIGAGGGGFLLLFVPPEKRPFVRLALSGFLEVPFSFEPEGSRIVYYKEEADSRPIDTSYLRAVSERPFATAASTPY